MSILSGTLRAFLIPALACAAVMPVFAGELPDTLSRAAIAVTRPDRSVLLGIAQAGGRLVVVGERGLIAVSDDEGKTWHQASVPVSVSLTAVSFATPKKGWALGHRGVILATSDGGESWTVQLDGLKFAEAALAEAKAASAASAPASGDERPRRSAAVAQAD